MGTIGHAPLIVRSRGGRGSSDPTRDPRGFALRFYTEDGNYDLVGNNTPVFFRADPEYGARVEKGLGLDANEAKKLAKMSNEMEKLAKMSNEERAGATKA